MTGLARKVRLGLAVFSVASFGAIAAPAANAGLLVSSAQSCDNEVLSHPFAGFGDNASYAPVPGGSFESGSGGWTLSGGAKVVAGNETYMVGSGADSHSLSLPAGATATSPAVCVGLNKPTLRYFSSQSGSLLGLTGAMTVDVLAETSLGAVVSVPLAPGLLTTSWSPGLVPTPIVANLLPLLPNDTTAVAFRFHAVTGNWGLDDVYVDPYCR